MTVTEDGGGREGCDECVVDKNTKISSNIQSIRAYHHG
jgi:hypothetical protein